MLNVHAACKGALGLHSLAQRAGLDGWAAVWHSGQLGSERQLHVQLRTLQPRENSLCTEGVEQERRPVNACDPAALPAAQLLWDKGQPYRAISEATVLVSQAQERQLAAPFKQEAEHSRFHAQVGLHERRRPQALPDRMLGTLGQAACTD